MMSTLEVLDENLFDLPEDDLDLIDAFREIVKILELTDPVLEYDDLDIDMEVEVDTTRPSDFEPSSETRYVTCNDWEYDCDYSNEDVLAYLDTLFKEIFNEDRDIEAEDLKKLIPYVDSDGFYEFLKDRYREAAIEDATENWEPDDDNFDDPLDD